jgi:hypothetical protein
MLLVQQYFVHKVLQQLFQIQVTFDHIYIYIIEKIPIIRILHIVLFHKEHLILHAVFLFERVFLVI